MSDDYLREGGMRKAMNEDRLTLDDAMRKVVHAAITGVCEHRGRTLRALNVRTNHVHIVLGAGGIDKPEKAMNTFKSWATRRLREAHLLDEEREHVWTRHGSTRWLFHPEDAEGAADYVLNQQ
ncbi:MAG: transposase [Planctomycetota bacterium]